MNWPDPSRTEDGTTVADLFRILRRRRRTILLVTDRLHMWRTQASYQRFGFHIVGKCFSYFVVYVGI